MSVRSMQRFQFSYFRILNTFGAYSNIMVTFVYIEHVIKFFEVVVNVDQSLVLDGTKGLQARVAHTAENLQGIHSPRSSVLVLPQTVKVVWTPGSGRPCLGTVALRVGHKRSDFFGLRVVFAARDSC